MRPRLRARLAFAMVSAGCFAGILGFAAGCGSKFDLPTERREGRLLVGDGTYQMIASRNDFSGIQDVLLCPSGELFLLFQDPVAKTGRVEQYTPSLVSKLSTTFGGLHNPTAIAFGANKLFVLDQGDTALARTEFPQNIPYDADCGPISLFHRPITNLAQYWYVRPYELDCNASTAGAFSDTTFAWVNGIAADANHPFPRVYVSGVQMFCVVDPFDSRLRTLTFRAGVRRYIQGTTGDGVVGNWHRDPDWIVNEGTGVGFAGDPRGMQWNEAAGEALYFADRGNNEIQKYADPAGYATSYKLEIDLNTSGKGYDADSLLFETPLDVSVDQAGFVYCLDAGNKRVLRYAPDETFVQRVDNEPDENQLRVLAPVAVSADTDQVYVADRGLNEVVRFRRRK